MVKEQGASIAIPALCALGAGEMCSLEENYWRCLQFFFSILGLGLYLWTCRPPKSRTKPGEEARQAHHEYVTTTFRKVTGSVIHCVGRDGLGIITAMVMARMINIARGVYAGIRNH